MSGTPTMTGIGVTAWAALMVLPWGHVDASADSINESAWTREMHGAQKSSWFYAGEVGINSENHAAISVKRDVSAIITELKMESGLTADQLGRLLGVSKRTVHNWAAGASITDSREERVRKLSKLIFSLRATSPEERRAALLDSTKGPSLFREFTADNLASQRIKHPLPVEERFGL